MSQQAADSGDGNRAVRAEPASVSSEGLLRMLLDNIPQGVYWKDLQARYLGCNPIVARAHGLASPEALIGLDDLQLPWLTRAQAEQFLAHDRRVMEQNQAEHGRIEPVALADGSTLWLEMNRVPLRDAAGNVVGLFGSWLDITGRKQAEEAIRQSEERYRGILETLPVGVFVHDGKRMSYANPKALRIMGVSRPEELTRLAPLDLVAPEFREMAARRMDAMLGSEEPLPPVEAAVIRLDGSRVQVEVNSRRTRFEDRDCLQVLFHEITERKTAEEAIRATGAFRETLIRTAAEGICACSAIPDFPYVQFSIWNDRMTEITGHTLEEINRFGWYQSLYPDPEVRARAIERMARMREGDDMRGEEWEITRRDGTRRTISISTSRVELQGGLEAVVAVMQDVTARKQSESSLRQRLLDLTVLSRVGEICTGSRTEDELLRGVTRAISETLYPNNCGFLLLDPDRGVLVTHPSFILSDPTVSRADKPLGAGVTGQVALSGQVRRIGDVSQASDYIAADARTRSELCIPLRIGSNVAGVLNVESEKLNQFSDTDEQMLCTVVDLVGNSLGRLRTERNLSQSEARLRLATEAANVGLWDWDLRTNEVYYSPKWKSQIGYREEEISPDFSEWRSRVHPEDLEPTLRKVQACRDNPQGRYKTEFRFRHKDGEYRWVYVQGDVLRDAAGEPVRMLGCHIDITDRKRAEESVERQKLRYQILLRTSQDALHVVAKDGGLREWNEAFLAHLGYSADEALTLRVMDWDTQWNRAELIEKIELLFQKGATFETTHRRKDGEIRNVEISATGFVFDGEELVLASARDITERKRAEAALRESETRLRAVIEHSPAVAVQWFDGEGRVCLWNSASETMFGYSAREALGQTLDQLIHTPEEYRIFLATLADIRRTGQSIPPTEYSFRRRNGETGVCLSTLFRIPGPADGDWFVCMDVDITARKRAEWELQESQQRFQTVTEAVPICLIMADEAGRITLVNAQAEQTFGYARDELLGKPIELLIPPEIRERHVELRRGFLAAPQHRPMAPGRELTGIRKDGTEFPVEVGLAPVPTNAGLNVLAAVVDITSRKRAEEERQKLEAQIRHTQKLESLGVLAGGIAHDFNNILTSILGYSDLALMELPPHSPARPLIAEAINGARKAAELTKQMLAYSGKGRFVIESLNLNHLIEEMVPLLQVSIPKKCVLKPRLSPNLDSIEADPVQIRQVIMNLIVNAADAIGDRSGVISVNTGVMHCDRAFLSKTYLDESLTPGRYVFLEVTDTGCGMTEEIRGRIFDPFFSTKATGRGLGLAALLGIVRGHRGALQVSSEVGQGTTFQVAFPASDLHAPSQPTGGAPVATWRGSGKVLVVDDEEAVRSLVSRMLELMGFTVLSARDGREGVEALRREGENIRLVILDMTMPHLDGAETLREMRRIRGDVKAILSSGYNEQSAIGQFADQGLEGFIQKPYRFDDLVVVIRSVLGD